MDFRLSEEQTVLKDTLERFIAREYAFEKRNTFLRSADGFSRDAWRQFGELGLLALPFDEQFGGMNGSPVDTMVVMQALAPALFLEPYLETVILCGNLIAAAGSEAQKHELLPAIAGGQLILAFAHHEQAARYDWSHIAATARSAGTGWVLNGVKSLVLHGAAADKLIVAARTSGDVDDDQGVSLFLIERDSAGLEMLPYVMQDGRRAADVTLVNVRVERNAMLGTKDKALPVVEQAFDYAAAALCAEAVGIMSALTAATVEYSKTRKQFGQPIGRFQALQHRMVDMTIAVEQARSMMYLAAARVGESDVAERTRAISAAKAYIGQAARYVGQQAVQLHGAMGMTDELIVSHWFRRLTAINTLLGDADYHLARFSDSLSERLLSRADSALASVQAL